MDDKTACFQQQLGERDAEINQLHRELQVRIHIVSTDIYY